MKRSLFVFSLLALLFMGFTASAQTAALAKPAQAPMTPLEAYKKNFTEAVNNGDITMADAHRQKLASYMEREITAVESGSKSATALSAKPGKTETDKDLARQKEIAAAFRNMDLSTAEAVSAAKTKLALIDEFNTISAKRRPATN